MPRLINLARETGEPGYQERKRLEDIESTELLPGKVEKIFILPGL